MPGLMAIREEFAAEQPLRGARITGSLHMTIQTAVLIETLKALGAAGALGLVQHLLDAGPCGRGDRGRAAPPVFAVKGETLAEYWDYTHRIFEWPDGGYSNMILDDGGDATLLLHLGAKAEKDASLIADARQRGGAMPVRLHQGEAQDRPRTGTRRASPRSRASPRRPPPASSACTRWPRRDASRSRPST